MAIALEKATKCVSMACADYENDFGGAAPSSLLPTALG
jgi:hypothetical protein